MRLNGLALIAGSLILAQQMATAGTKASISGEVFFKTYDGVSESKLRKDAMWKMTELTIHFPGTALADEARAVVRADRDRADEHAWIADTLKVVGDGLRAYPPSNENWQVRRRLFELLDCPIHVETGDEFHRAMAEFYRPFLDKTFKEIRAAKVKKGLRVWHIYNMGFIVKSPNHTLAFDVFPREAAANWSWLTLLTEKQTKELAGLVDIAFISHWHDDHSNHEFLKAVSAAGKPMVVPAKKQMPAEFADIQGMTPVRDTPANAPLMFDGIEVNSFAGWQGDEECNVYVVKMDGYSISQNGDNCDMSVYPRIAAGHKIDLALANCWSGTNEYVLGVNPEFYTTGHENELHHGITHRIGYGNTFGNIDRLGVTPPTPAGEPKPMVLHCGESMECLPQRK